MHFNGLLLFLMGHNQKEILRFYFLCPASRCSISRTDCVRTLNLWRTEARQEMFVLSFLNGASGEFVFSIISNIKSIFLFSLLEKESFSFNRSDFIWITVCWTKIKFGGLIQGVICSLCGTSVLLTDRKRMPQILRAKTLRVLRQT